VINSDDAQKSVRDIRHRIVDGGEDFAKLAKQYSQDVNSANLGGDMGWFPIDQYGTRVAEVLATLKDGEISQPFQTDVGWHILQRIATREQDRTQEMKRSQATDVLRGRKAEEEYDNYLRQMRSEAYVCAVGETYASASLPACGSASTPAVVEGKKAEGP
jgi:peptidyl-prolyl cis-trans isomerase SurA